MRERERPPPEDLCETLVIMRCLKAPDLLPGLPRGSTLGRNYGLSAHLHHRIRSYF